MELVIGLIPIMLFVAIVWGVLSRVFPRGPQRKQPEPPFDGGAVEYDSYDAFKLDSPKRIADGWRIAGVTDMPQRAGVGRIATLGIGAVVIKPAPHVMVIYERATLTPDHQNPRTL